MMHSGNMSSHDECQLTPIIEFAELCQLRDMYGQDWPRHCIGYYCLDNFIRWLRLSPQIRNLNIFTVNNDWRKTGLFLIEDRYQLFVHSLNLDDNTELYKALSLLDWSIGYKVSSIRQYHLEAVLSVIEEKNLKLEYNNETFMYHLSCGEAIKIEVRCPAGYFLCPLKESDAKCIDDLWLNKHKGSLFLIKRLIAWNVNMGIYASKSNELIAWCLRLQGGFLGALQVKAAHRGLGLGAVIVAAISHRIAEMGDDVMALVYESNNPARHLFEKLGFSLVDKCYWLRSFPTAANFEWPENIMQEK